MSYYGSFFLYCSKLSDFHFQSGFYGPVINNCECPYSVYCKTLIVRRIKDFLAHFVMVCCIDSKYSTTAVFLYFFICIGHFVTIFVVESCSYHCDICCKQEVKIRTNHLTTNFNMTPSYYSFLRLSGVSFCTLVIYYNHVHLFACRGLKHMPITSM